MAVPTERREASHIKAVSEKGPIPADIGNQQVTGRSSNYFGAESAKKNPDALAGAVEAKLDVKAHCFRGEDTAKPSANAMMKFAKPEHKRMSRTLGYALTLGTFDAWAGFTAVAAARMSDTERASLAFAALNSLDLDQAEMVAAAVIRPIGTPLPAFLGGMDDARWWADHASRSELKAYALAAHDAMNAQDQAAFFQHIREVEIAA